MQNILRLLPLALISTSMTVDASRESVAACVESVETINEHIELQEAFNNMLTGYNTTCQEEGLCKLEIDEDTLFELKNMDEVDKDAPLPAMKGSAVAHFGKAFKMHKSFLAYETACSDAGGDLECVDGHMVLQGEAGAAFLKNEEGVDTDIDIKILSYPVCLPKECEGEDLTKVLENSAKDAILKAPAIAEELTAHSESLIKSITVDQVCALSGLETCTLEVKAVGCELSESSGAINNAGRVAGVFVLAASALVALL